MEVLIISDSVVAFYTSPDKLARAAASVTFSNGVGTVKITDFEVWRN
jgi:hypothetical protein